MQGSRSCSKNSAGRNKMKLMSPATKWSMLTRKRAKEERVQTRENCTAVQHLCVIDRHRRPINHVSWRGGGWRDIIISPKLAVKLSRFCTDTCTQACMHRFANVVRLNRATHLRPELPWVIYYSQSWLPRQDEDLNKRHQCNKLIDLQSMQDLWCV